MELLIKNIISIVVVGLLVIIAKILIDLDITKEVIYNDSKC